MRWTGGQEDVIDETTFGQRPGGMEELAKEKERAQQGQVQGREGAGHGVGEVCG